MSHLIATPEASNANAYVTEADANTYLTTYRLYFDAWTAADTETRENALIWATNLIDASFDFYGNKTTLEQALRFPRSGLVDEDGNNVDYHTIPVQLERATAELALYLLTQDPTKLPSVLGKGVSHIRLDVLEIDADMQALIELIPQQVISLLSPFGSLKPSAIIGGARQVRLLRT